MQNEIIINAEVGETRIALLERGQFAELHIERDRDKSVVGNVVKGRVMRVLPGMQAAFVDIGLEKAAFLYVGDYFESTLETGDTEGEPGSRNRKGGGRGGRGSRSAPPRIDTVLHEGKEIVVQIAKEPIGTKGARITSSISIPGRHLVLTPWSRRVGVSRRIGSDRERRRLREIVERLRPQNLGFIIRTAGDGVREADLQADIRYLATVWAAVQKRHEEQPAPAILYSEHDLPLRIVRDLAGHETKRIAADDKDVYESIQNFVDRFVADPKPNVEHYEDNNPIFERFDLESQIHANLERKVWLKSGGSLVIDKSEALTAIDVNTGRFVGKRDLEETVLKTNLEAVAEVVHQLRFRNLGGLIIIDLIDMESAGNREKVYRALQEALRADKARTNILKISELGLVEMTRKRTRENLVQTLCEPCSYCEGRSYVLSPESVAFRVLRELRKHIPRLGGRSIAVSVNPHVAEKLLSEGKTALAKVSDEIGKPVEIRARPGLHQEQYELTVLEAGPPAELSLPWLREFHPDSEEGKALAKTEAAAEKAAQREARATQPDAEDSEEGDNASAGSGRRRTRGGRGRSRGGRGKRSSETADDESTDQAENGKVAGARDAKTGKDDRPDEEVGSDGETPRKRRRSRRRKAASTPAESPEGVAAALGAVATPDDDRSPLRLDDDDSDGFEPFRAPRELKRDALPRSDAPERAVATNSAAAEASPEGTSEPISESNSEAAPKTRGDTGPEGLPKAAGDNEESSQTVDSKAESRIIPRSE